MTYLRHVQTNTAETPQNEPMLGAGQTKNSAGGYSWSVTDWQRLDRFLILGSDKGSYYASERQLTQENASAVLSCIKADGPRVVRRIAEISEAGRAPKTDPGIFALAMCASLGEEVTRRDALAALPEVCRIGTHLFHFAEYVKGMRGWGKGLHRALQRWYNERPAQDVAFQAVKYQQRDGWSHRDILRKARPKPPTEAHKTVYNWITKGWPDIGEAPHHDEALRLVWAFERAQRTTDAAEMVKLITDYRLPREAVPTHFLTDAGVWAALLDDMPMTALIRNLATMTRVGLVKPMSTAARLVVAQLGDTAQLRKARVHPIALLSALITYGQGHGERSSNTWEPVREVVDALDGAFYASFGVIEPSGKRLVLALDVSGSMGNGVIAGVPGLTPRVASAAMALITAATEADYVIVGFSHELVPVPISPRQRLDDVIKTVNSIQMGATDCALPMLWALEHGIEADGFVVYTDSETWCGKVHPSQALARYRQETGIPAKLTVVGMVANDFTIADPNDGGMMDVVGFDTATPDIISGFIRQ